MVFADGIQFMPIGNVLFLSKFAVQLPASWYSDEFLRTTTLLAKKQWSGDVKEQETFISHHRRRRALPNLPEYKKLDALDCSLLATLLTDYILQPTKGALPVNEDLEGGQDPVPLQSIHSKLPSAGSMDLAEDEEEVQEYQEGEGEEGETTTDTGPQGTPLRLAETVKKQKTTNITITNKHQQDLTTFYPTTIQQAYLLSPAVCFIHRTPTSPYSGGDLRPATIHFNLRSTTPIKVPKNTSVIGALDYPSKVKLKEQIGYRKSVSIPMAASASSGLSIGKSSGDFSVVSSPLSIRSASSLCIKASLEDLR
ncbi:MAG: hypothetical protein J3Q66DRAFT_401029 [Benniella sp.]|nr:MAG: hypothetical protein J3Q66DRAFT_401029 [Benniella sp.]